MTIKTALLDKSGEYVSIQILKLFNNEDTFYTRFSLQSVR